MEKHPLAFRQFSTHYLPRRLCARHSTRVINSCLTGWVYALIFQKIRDNPKTDGCIDVKLGRTSPTTIWHGLCGHSLWVYEGQFRDMSDFVASVQATFDRKITKLCESVKTQRRIWKCNCKLKLPKDVKWQNLQGGYLGFPTLGDSTLKFQEIHFLNYPQIQIK